MTKKSKTGILIFSVIFYAVTTGLMIYGTFNDLKVDMALFNPENKLAIGFECFGEAAAWIVWGPIFTVLFVTRHNLNESLEIIGRILPFVKPVSDTKSKVYKLFNGLLSVITTLGFFVLGVIGYKKIIENVAKKFVDIPQWAYFLICAVVTAVAIFLFNKIDRNKLNKLESLSLACLFVGLFYKAAMHLKPISHRIRFREMVAYSNGVLDEQGFSHGTLHMLQPRTNKSMLEGTDFSAFTRWYIKGDDMGIYSHPDSFPSGHTISACSTFLSALIFNSFEKLKKCTPLMLILSMAYVYVMGFTRMVEGAHYLTDVAAGALLGYTVFLIVWVIYNQFCSKAILPTRKLD